MLCSLDRATTEAIDIIMDDEAGICGFRESSNLLRYKARWNTIS